VRVQLQTDPTIACPTLGVVIYTDDGRELTSAGSFLDHVALPRQADGSVAMAIDFPALPLLKGRYTVSVFVLCDRAINLYAAAHHALAFEVVQADVCQGLVALPHQWRLSADADAGVAATVHRPS
jgi:lipopolysaccharide transport system ATP-binding protein